MLNKDLIIAIDGHSSSGKSTFAKAIAREMGYTYIDSGAMYRAVTYLCLETGVLQGSHVDMDGLADRLRSIQLDFRYDRDNQKFETILNGHNVEDEIRSLRVSDHVSQISKIGQVRDKMVEIQRKLGKHKRIVMDGRDIGTVVFPYADLKIFLTANESVRARRRHKELDQKGINTRLSEVEKNIQMRDRIDQTRELSPLQKAPDAITLDNSNMTMEDQMDWFRNLIKKLGK